MLDFYRVGRVPIHLVSVNSVRDTVVSTLSEDRKGYICISNMRTVALAQKDDAYFRVMEHSLLNTPDGTPLVWCGKLWGLRQVERVAGPDVFVSLLKTSLSQFFLGDTEEVLSRLTERVQQEYGTKVAGMFSPPFAPIETYDLQAPSWFGYLSGPPNRIFSHLCCFHSFRTVLCASGSGLLSGLKSGI